MGPRQAGKLQNRSANLDFEIGRVNGPLICTSLSLSFLFKLKFKATLN